MQVVSECFASLVALADILKCCVKPFISLRAEGSHPVLVDRMFGALGGYRMIGALGGVTEGLIRG